MTWALSLMGAFFVIVCTFLIVQPLGKGNRYRPEKETYQALQDQTFGLDDLFRKTFGGASVEKRKGLLVLKLAGSPYEMGLQHGKLLKHEIEKGVLNYHANYVDHFSPQKNKPWLSRLFHKRYWDWRIYLTLLRNAPDSFKQELKGLADGCGLPFDIVFRGNMLSEFNMNRAIMQNKKLQGDLAQTECTSFAVFGSMSEDGSLLMGRNTDYSGAGLWDHYQTVFFYEPQEGYRYANVGTAGSLKCNSCMNEKGLCLGGHFLYADDVSPKGVGFTALEIEIMRKAETIADAWNIVAHSPRAGAFAFLLSSTRDRTAAVLEACANRVGLKIAQDDHIHETNFMTTDELKQVDFLLKHGFGKNPVARYARVGQVLREFAGKITPQKAAEFLGDHYNVGSQSFRPLGHVIATLNNLSSVVFQPRKLTFWVASGLAPVCNNPYYGFDFRAEFADRQVVVRPSVLAPNNYTRTVGFESLREYYPLRRDVLIGGFNPAALTGQLEEIIHRIPGEAVYRIVLAKMLLSLGKFNEACEHLHLLQDSSLSVNEQAQIDFLIGAAHDLKGERQQALRRYRSVLDLHQIPDLDILSSVNPLLVNQARKFTVREFSEKDMRNLEISLDMATALDI